MKLGSPTQPSTNEDFFMTPSFDLHPLCTLFPRMVGAEYENLKSDIQINGLRTPITTYDGMILDGGNRYRACVDLGIRPMFDKYVGSDLSSFVLTSNLHRRHLTPGQQAAIVACVQDWAKAHTHGGNRVSSATNSTCSDTAKSRSNQSGTSIATQRKADAVAKASPKLAAEVARGEISLNAATREVAPQLAPKLDQKPEEPQEPEYTELDAARDQITELQDMLAAGSLSQEDAKTYVDGLRKEIKTLTATLAATESQRDSFMRECAELKKQCAMQVKKIKKLESAK